MSDQYLIYGAEGWIGQQFVALCRDVSWVAGKARCDDEEAVRAELDTVKPTHVICLIGRTHGPGSGTIDYLEGKDKLGLNIRDNLFAPLFLGLECRSRGIHLTYMGTGCIFNGLNNYDEEAKPDFFGSSYSVVKGYTDRLMHCFRDTVLNLRIRMPITGKPHPRNFITKIAGYARICSMDNSMSVLDDLLPLALDLIKRRYTGTLNLVNPGTITHNRILELYRESVSPGFTWVNMTLEEQSQVLASARSNNSLSTELLESLFEPGRVLPIEESVRRALVRYAKEMPERVIMVTGGCGFIGSNFINGMVEKYGSRIKIVNIDAMYYCARRENVSVPEGIGYRFYKCNIRDKGEVLSIMQREQPEVIVHFAAQSHVDSSFNGDLSLEYSLDNCLGTHALMEACRVYGRFKKIIHVSTDEVYGSSLDDERHEASILCPTNPYSATKAGAEMIAISYRYSFGLPIIITRGNNVYGPNQYPEKLIPRWLNLLSRGESLTIAGNGTQIRSFLWVGDVCRAFDILLEKGVVGEIYNIGSLEEYSVNDVARLIQEISGKPVGVRYIEDRPFNDKRYFINSSKLEALGWRPEVDFKTGLSRLIHHKN